MVKFQEKFMERAILLSHRAALIEKCGGPFGAVIVKDNEIIAEGYNQVLKQHDPTWHGEMQAIREACKKLKSPHLTGCILYTSAEPCPMCLAASYWAHIDHIFYGARIEDAKKYGNFADINYYDEIKRDPNERQIRSTELLRDDALKVWMEFSKVSKEMHY